MRILIADTAGFCWGVRRAVNTVLDIAAESKKTVYTHGPLIHNKEVVEQLENYHIYSLEALSEKDKKNFQGTVVVRAHGVRPEIIEDLKKEYPTVKDATCPLVARVQRAISKHLAEGYHIVILGEKNHAEVKGLIGYSKDKATVIDGIEQAKALPTFKEKICLVSQTTQNEKVFEEIENILRKKTPHLKAINTICDPTRSHQRETINLAKICDMMVVIGGRHSANTVRLVRLTESLGVKTLHVEKETELKAKDFENVKTLGITAGASTPQWMILRIKQRIESFQNKWYSLFIKRLARLVSVFSRYHILGPLSFAALTAVFYTAFTGKTPELWPDFFKQHLILYFYALFGLHNFFYFFPPPDFDRKSLDSPRVIKFRRRFMIIFSSVWLVLLLLSAFYSAPLTGLFLSLIFSSSLLYHIKKWPSLFKKLTGFENFSEIYVIKDIGIFLIWSFLALLLLLPEISPYGMQPKLIFSFFIWILLFAARSIMSGFYDVWGERPLGFDTFIGYFGKKKTFRVLSILLLSAFILSLIAVPLLNDSSFYFLSIISLYMAFFLSLYRFRLLPSGAMYHFLFDGLLILISYTMIFKFAV